MTTGEHHRSPDKLNILIDRADFSPEALEKARAESGIEWLVIPSVEEAGDRISMTYGIQGLQSLNDLSLQGDAVALIRGVSLFTDRILSLGV